MVNGKSQKNNIMSENKGRGLFYGVIAIATFIVMAVGATFAYFTATTESMNTAVQTGSTTLQLEYISYESAWSNNDLIPADTMVVEYSVEYQNDTTLNAEKSATSNLMCKDDYGNSICSIYVFQVRNSAASPQTVSLNVVSNVNSFASLNAMAYELAIPSDRTEYDSTENGNGSNDAVFKKSDDDPTTNAIEVKDGNGSTIYTYEPVYVNRKGVVKTLQKYVESRDELAGTIIESPALDREIVAITEDNQYAEATERTAKIADNIVIDGGETKTFALVLYIKNENWDQTDTDAAKKFQGQVVVSSGDGSMGVSGTIGAVSADDFDPDKLQSNQNTQTEDNEEPGTSENGEEGA